MCSTPVHTESHNGCTIELSQDECDENPIKEWDMLGEFICGHKQYDLGNTIRFKDASRETIVAYAKKTRSMLFNLYAYIHSGIALSLSNTEYPFTCPWDSGQLGFVLVDREKMAKEYGKEGKPFRLTSALKKKIREVIQGEVKTYNMYLSGDVWCVNIKGPDGEEIDNYGGSYGYSESLKEAKGEIDSWLKREQDKLATARPVAMETQNVENM